MEPDPLKPQRTTRGGAYVLAFTGATMLVLAAKGTESRFDFVLLGFVGIVLLWASFRLTRFIRQHGGEIGEARFDTRNKD